MPHSTGGVSDKVPDPNIKPVAVVSIYHGTDDGLIQDMDSLDTDELDAQLLVDKLIEYGVLTQGTKVLSFTVEGKKADSASSQGPGAEAQTEEAVGTLMELTLRVIPLSKGMVILLPTTQTTNR